MFVFLQSLHITDFQLAHQNPEPGHTTVKVGSYQWDNHHFLLSLKYFCLSKGKEQVKEDEGEVLQRNKEKVC